MPRLTAANMLTLIMLARSDVASATDCFTSTKNNGDNIACELAKAKLESDRVDCAYAAVLAVADSSSKMTVPLSFKAQIKRTQAQWASWASSECKLEGDVIMGSAGGVVEAICLQRLDADRVRALDDLAKALPN